MTLGDWIKNYVESQKMSRDEFAARTNISKGYVSMLINNYNPQSGKPPEPSLDIYKKVAKGAGVSLEDILAATQEDLPSFYTTVPAKDAEQIPKAAKRIPDLEAAALKASETLIKYRVDAAPILPLSILQSMKDVIIVSFTEMADENGMDRNSLETMYGAAHQDAVTYQKIINGKSRYVIAYNLRMPFSMIQFALARELGHVLLKHDISNIDVASMTEALYFARYFLCPRPLIKGLQKFDIPLTVEMIGNLTGCYGRALAGIRKTPGAHIPAQLNRYLQEQFTDYLATIKECHAINLIDNDSMIADFGSYMDNYEE